MIYLVVLLMLATFAWLYDVSNLREGASICYWVSYVVLVCLAGFRYEVGGDTLNYIYTYDFLPSLGNLFTTEIGISKLQPLWVLFSATAKSIGDEFYVFQILHAIAVNSVIFHFIQKNSRFRHTGVLLYSFSIYPFFNFEILREALAICCFLVSIHYYKNNNWLRYYFLSSLAFLFHLSAVFLFLLPIFKKIRLGPRGLLLLFTVSALLNPIVMAAISSPLASQLIGVAIGGYEEYHYTFFGLVSIFLLYLLVPLAVTWTTQVKLKITSEYDSMARVGLVIAATIPLFFIFYRFFNYFSMLYLLLACELIHGITKTRKFRKIKLLFVPALLGFFFVFYAGKYFQDTSHLAQSTRWYNRWYPYYSIFDPMSFPPREEMIETLNNEAYEQRR
jgi:hypothetical protein